MTKDETRQSYEYARCKGIIVNYPQGFKFTLPYYRMTKGQINAWYLMTDDFKKEGLIQSVAISMALDGEITEETFIRL